MADVHDTQKKRGRPKIEPRVSYTGRTSGAFSFRRSQKRPEQSERQT